MADTKRQPESNWAETETATKCLSHLCLSEHLSDISFIFSANKKVKLPVHKCVLSMRSEVFEAMFYGSLSENEETVLIEDVEPDVMKAVLRFVYSDNPKIDGNNVLPCLCAAKKYKLSGLVKQCSDFLENKIDVDTVFQIHEKAIIYKMIPEQERCLAFITDNATSVFRSKGFLKVSHATLLELLKRDELESSEIDVFKAAVRWAEHLCVSNNKSKIGTNLRDQLGEALFQIRFPIMRIEDFVKIVTPSEILTDEELLMLYQNIASKGSTPLEKFCEQKRLFQGIKVTLHQNTEHDMSLSFGCDLEIGVCKDSSKSQTSSESIKIKSVTGKFIENVSEIILGETKTTNYKKKGDRIIFTNPIDISDDIRVQFLLPKNENTPNFGNDHGVGPVPSPNFGILDSRAFSYHPNKKEHVNGHDIIIKTFPVGLKTIIFI